MAYGHKPALNKEVNILIDFFLIINISISFSNIFIVFLK